MENKSIRQDLQFHVLDGCSNFDLAKSTLS